MNLNYRWMTQQWERVLVVVLVAAGVLLLLIGWLGVSRSSLTTEQIPYLASNGLGGLFCLGVGATLWVTASLRDELAKLDELTDLVGGDGSGAGERLAPLESGQAAGELPVAAVVRPGERTGLRAGNGLSVGR